MVAIFRLKSLIFGISLLLLTAVLACGEAATPSATPQPTQDVAAIVQQVLAQQEQPDALTAADIQQLVQGVVTQALADQPAPEGLTAQQVQDLVQNAIAATVQPGASALEVQTAIAAAVGAIQPGVSAEDVQAAVEQAVEQALAAVPTAGATPTPLAMMEPSGTLDWAIPSIDVPIWVPRVQPYLSTQFEVMTFGETMFGWSDAPTNNLEPRLVETWDLDISTDGTATYTFNLRQGVPFQTQFGLWGEVTAEDWIFSAQSTGGPDSIHSQLGNARSWWLCDGCEMTAPDPYTLVLNHPTGSSGIPARWSGYPGGDAIAAHSKKHVDARGEEQAAKEPVGAGPWELVEYDQDVRARVKAVQNHYRITPQWDEWIWWVIREESTRLANFEAGLLDTAALSTESIQAIKSMNDPDIKFMKLPSGIVHHLTFLGNLYNLDHPAHADVGDVFDCTQATVACDRNITSADWANASKVREAMNIAIDRDALVANLSFGEGTPIFTMHGTGYLAKLSEFLDLDAFNYEFNADGARALLAEAGFADGFELDMRIASWGSPATIPPMKAVANMWRAIGITVNEIEQPYGTFRPSLVNRSAQGVWNWSGGPSTLEPSSSYGLQWNAFVGINAGVEHPFLQERIDLTRIELDLDARYTLTAEMIQFVRDHNLGIPLFTEPVLFPIGPELDVWTLSGFGSQARLSNWEHAGHR